MIPRRALLLLALGFCIALPVLSQEKNTDPKEPAKAIKKTAEKATKGPSHRLPTHFKQLELSEGQRDQIYAVQDKFSAKIEKLEEQLRALQAERTSEIEALLTADQKEKLATLRDQGKSKSPKEKTTSDTKPAK